MISPYGEEFWSNFLDNLDYQGKTSIHALDEENNLELYAQKILSSVSGKIDIIGFCMGGYLAFELVRKSSSRIKRLALINSSPFPDSPAQAEARRRRIASLETKANIMQFPDESYVGYATQWLLSQVSMRKPAIVAQARQIISDLPLSVSIAQQKAMLGRPDSRRLLPHLAIPTLIVAGDSDRMVPARLAQEMAQAIPGARLQILRDCGHLAPLEAPMVVAYHANEWLKSDI